MRRGLAHPSSPDRQTPPAPPARPAKSSAGVREPDAPLTVSALTRIVKTLLEDRVGTVAVTGEVSGLKASPSGHVYFALKDAAALVDCVVWRSAAGRLRELPADGTKVTVQGKLTVYEPRGRYQLVVTSISSGTEKGELWRRFEALKDRLAAQGLFAPERKIPLPPSPAVVGIVTSPTGAALRDILKILSRRAPAVRTVLAPALVQGTGAAADIARALAMLDRWGGADVIIVGRGGGALEDLWAFNEEEVALAIANCRTPVVSAVGHETDFTIADFVADARAVTPSEAAERIVPDCRHLLGRVAHVAGVLSRALSGAVRERREALRGVASRRAYRRPGELVMPLWQRLDDASGRLRGAVEGKTANSRSRLDVAGARLAGLSPLGVLARGYAVVLDGNGRTVRSAAGLAPGDIVRARLAQGEFAARVTEAR